MTPRPLTDAQGFVVSTSSELSAWAYALGVELLLGSSREATSMLRLAVEADPSFELARVALACALAAADPPAASDGGSAPSRPSTRRERQHVDVIRSVLDGERERAAVLGREHLREFPGDVLVVHMLTSHGLT